MTVQQLIDMLNKIQDKSQTVSYVDSEWGISDIVEVNERYNPIKNFAWVELSDGN